MRRRLPRFLRPTTVLLPVPSCPVRFRARGFNPAAEIAMSLADSVGVDCELSAVARRRGAVPQSSLKREALVVATSVVLSKFRAAFPATSLLWTM